MVSIAERVKEELPSSNERIIDTDIFLDEMNIPIAKRKAALRELSRLESDRKLDRLAKGVYAKSEISNLTKKNKPVSDKEIVRYYTKDNRGLTIGYDLYNRRNISTQVSKKKTILSTRLKKASRTVKSIKVKKTDLNLDNHIKDYLEILEIVENSDTIQDFNTYGFYNLMIDFSENYDAETMNYILDRSSYKKQTIYNIHKILRLFGKNSGLEKYLNTTSRYKETLAYEAIYSQQ